MNLIEVYSSFKKQIFLPFLFQHILKSIVKELKEKKQNSVFSKLINFVSLHAICPADPPVHVHDKRCWRKPALIVIYRTHYDYSQSGPINISSHLVKRGSYTMGTIHNDEIK